MERIDEGKSGVIYSMSPEVVMKVPRKHGGITEQKRIHRICNELLRTSPIPFYILRIPALIDPDSPTYTMERVDTSRPIFLALEPSPTPLLLVELTRAWLLFWTRAGFAAYDFELYIQPDGTVVLLDFDSFVLRQSGDDLPPPTFFHHPSFPQDFRKRLC